MGAKKMNMSLETKDVIVQLFRQGMNKVEIAEFLENNCSTVYKF